MEFFKSFNNVLYSFGNEISTVSVQDLSTYVDVIDQVKDDISVYQKHHILEGYRPDQLSFELYQTSIFHWTFYLINDHIRLQGWPLTATELDETVKHNFPHTVVTTRDILGQNMLEGQTVTGSVSGSTGVITHRNLDLGQLVIDGPNGFRAGEVLSSTIFTEAGETTQTIVIVSSEEEYNAAHHYVQNGFTNIVDVDPQVGPGELLTEVSNYEWYRDENEKLRDIKVIRPNIIENLAASFKQGIRS